MSGLGGGSTDPLAHVLLILANRFLSRGTPTHIRSDNGPEFIARKLRHWLNAREVAPRSIEPGSPWENGDVASCHGKMREQFLNGELFTHSQKHRS